MRIIGRYALFDEIASGGMATVHLGRLIGPEGFSRTVAIKRLHPQFAKDPEFVAMFLDEARLASRIQHPNVVSTLDVVTLESEVFLVMDYVTGESLARLIRNAQRAGQRMPPKHVATVMAGVLYGLHAAHEAKSERREPLHIVHRDVSPQNVLVGTDGVARVLDFGVAKAALRSQSTRHGQTKGKFSYMAPEQMSGEETDRRTDIFAAGIVLWEALCGKRLFQGSNLAEICTKVQRLSVPPPSSIVPGLSERMDHLTLRALERDPSKRFQTAREFAIELENAGPMSNARQVGEWVAHLTGSELQKRMHMLAEIEGMSADLARLARTGSEAKGVRGDAFLISGATSATVPEARLSLRPGSASERSSPVISQVISAAPATSAVETAVPDFHGPRRRRLTRLALALAICLGVAIVAHRVLGPSPALPVNAVRATPPKPPAAPAPLAPVVAPVVKIEELPVIPTELSSAVSPAPPSSAASPLVSEPDARVAVPRTRVLARPRKPSTQKAEKVEAAPKRPARPAAPAKPAVNCDPPWTVDQAGIRRLKPECL
jgi:serine/threonine-protein kinase